MDNILLIVFIIVASSLVAMAFLLFQENKKLKRQYHELKDQLARNNEDISGLCSAAVSVDTRLSSSDEQLKNIVEKIIDFEEGKQQQTAQPYHSAIQKVRQGASSEDLISQCGLTQEEAILLIRLHGNS